MRSVAARLGIIFLIGAVAGTAYDYVHVYYRVLAYEHPDFIGTSLAFVPMEFGVSAVMGALAARFLSSRLAAPAVTLKRTALDGLLLLVSYWFTGIFSGQNTLTFVSLLPLVGVAIATRPTRFVLAGSLFAAIVGPLSEISVSAAGIFHYLHADPIPIWLPLLWMVAAAAFMDVAILLKVCFLPLRDVSVKEEKIHGADKQGAIGGG
ncbi:MAG: DUF2878 family protein [Deltaproteobacteria bacterium]|nr:DUF2878 family protein [Deltaproteobacteria bacterium]